MSGRIVAVEQPSGGVDYLHECEPRPDGSTSVGHWPDGWCLNDGEYTHPIVFCPYCGTRLPDALLAKQKEEK